MKRKIPRSRHLFTAAALLVTENGCPGYDFEKLLFEAVSAVTTTGLAFTDTTAALRAAVGIRSRIHFNRYYLAPLLEKGLIVRNDPGAKRVRPDCHSKLPQ